MKLKKGADKLFLKEASSIEGIGKKIRFLSKPLPSHAVFAFFLNWALILVSVMSCKFSPWLAPIAIILVGSRQRALSNLVHEASHENLFQKKNLNSFFGNVLAAFPMFETVAFYRSSHINHHRNLGDILLDPDSKNHLRYGFNDELPWTDRVSISYKRLFLNFHALIDSFLGSLLKINFSDHLKVLAWWTSLCVVFLALEDTQGLFIFCAIWFVARATSYHAIRIFAEFLDHTGLVGGSNLSFTRNIPEGTNLIRWLVHPHNDNLHLVHHLYPKVPNYNLNLAHEILCQVPSYLSAHNCDGYFIGRHAAIDCWLGRCRGKAQ